MKKVKPKTDAGSPPDYKDALLRLVASIVGGLAIVASNPNLELWPMMWLAFIPLFWSIENQTPKHAFGYGALFGAAVYLGGYYWLVHTISVFGGFPLWLSIILYCLLCIFCGLEFGFFALIINRIEAYGNISRFIYIPALLVSLEFVYPLLFPWTLAASMYRLPLAIQISDLFGAYSVSWLIIFFNLLAYLSLRALIKKEKPPLVAGAVFTILISVSLLYGYFRLSAIEEKITEAPKLKVGIVQSNIGIEQKRLIDDKAEIHRIHNEISYQAAADLGSEPDLIVWPESSFRCWSRVEEDGSIVLTRCPTRETELIDQLPDSWLLFGGLAYSRIDGEINSKYNTAIMMDNRRLFIDHSAKAYLLAFGEYMPGAKTFPSLQKISKHTGDFTPGDNPHLLLGPKGARIASIICYEDIIPEFTRRLAARGANVMINVTNDSWFGASSEPYQHLSLAVFRSVENRLFLLRSVNTGVSAVVSPTGEILRETDIFVRAAIGQEISLLSDRTVYSYIGDVFAWSALATILFAGAAAIRRKRKAGASRRPGPITKI